MNSRTLGPDEIREGFETRHEPERDDAVLLCDRCGDCLGAEVQVAPREIGVCALCGTRSDYLAVVLSFPRARVRTQDLIRLAALPCDRHRFWWGPGRRCEKCSGCQARQLARGYLGLEVR